jgi:hypothetical protein
MPTENDDQIHYDPSLNAQALPITVQKKDNDSDAKTLLHLMFYALHTTEGREYFRTHKWRPEIGLSDTDRTALIKKCVEYGVTREDLQDAIIQAQIAGEQFAIAYKARDFGVTRKNAETVYLQKMAFITWCLWEDTKGHEFSLGW